MASKKSRRRRSNPEVKKSPLEKKGLKSLEIADNLIHQMFEIMRIGLKNRYPQLSPEELKNKMRDISRREQMIRNKRTRR